METGLSGFTGSQANLSYEALQCLGWQGDLNPTDLLGFALETQKPEQ